MGPALHQVAVRLEVTLGLTAMAAEYASIGSKSVVEIFQ